MTNPISRIATVWANCRFAALPLSSLIILQTAAQQSILPPVRKPPNQPTQLSDSARVFVREFRFVGNRVFSDAALQRIVAPYTGRELDSTQLEEARQALTLHYVQTNRFINSGALLEDQRVDDGVIEFRIVEGALADIEIFGNKRLRTNFLHQRIQRGAGAPLNFDKLEQTLFLLKENPNIQQLNAELKPGPVPGESRLEVTVAEKNPWHLGLQARNDRPPSVGADVIELLGSNQNLSGHSDALDIRYGLVQWSTHGWKPSGSDNLGATYRTPINARDTTLQLNYMRSDYAIIEEPFTALDIKGQSDIYSVALSHPLYRTPNREFSMTLAGERRHSESFLLDEPFSFSAGAVEGETSVSALRFVQDWLDRSQDRVIALRSTVSWGIDVLGSTDDGTDRDGKFVAWLGQAQYVRRLAKTDNQLILSASFQWASDPLLSLEQLSLGGAHSVRGYRENQLVRDLGLISTVEFRIPILFAKGGVPTLQVAPFFDYGNGWNLEGLKGSPRDIASAGVGLIFSPNEKMRAELYWGYPFRNFQHPQERDAQDLGLHFRFVLWAF